MIYQRYTWACAGLGTLAVAGAFSILGAACSSSPSTPSGAEASTGTGGGSGPGAGGAGQGGAGPGGAGQGGAGDGGKPPVNPSDPTQPVLYVGGRRHAPAPKDVVQHWQSIIAQVPGRNPKNFIRLGDNLSHKWHLLGCMQDGPPSVDLATHAALQPTIDWFKGGSIQGVSPFAYEKDFENVSTSVALDGSPNLIQQEVTKGNPAFAVIMFGSLDLGWAGDATANRKDDPKVAARFGPDMLAIIDSLIGQGVLPLVRTIPPEGDSNMGPWRYRVQLINGIIRAAAQARQVPFADFYLDAKNLGPEGFWDDGLHLSAAPSGACTLTDAAAMKYGDNLMNVVALEQLDRVERGVVDGAMIDQDHPTLGGKGTIDTPFEIVGVPFADSRTLGPTSASVIDDYGTCAPAGPAGAPELVYHLKVTQTTALRAFVFEPNGGTLSPSVTHFSGSVSAASCKSHDASLLELQLEPGDHYFVVRADGALDGDQRFIFGMETCGAGDPTCIAEP